MPDVTIADIERLRAEADGADAVFEMDEDTFRALYDRTSRALWAYLSRLTGSADAADDLLQETYYRFLRAEGRHENEAHRRHSLFRIATNLARDGWRRESHARLVPLPETPHGELAAKVDVAGDAERRTDLTRALLQLTPRERAMLWLAYAHGSSHREIAGTVGVKTASVKLLLFRARRKLARVFRDPSRQPLTDAVAASQGCGQRAASERSEASHRSKLARVFRDPSRQPLTDAVAASQGCGQRAASERSEASHRSKLARVFRDPSQQPLTDAVAASQGCGQQAASERSEARHRSGARPSGRASDGVGESEGRSPSVEK